MKPAQAESRSRKWFLGAAVLGAQFAVPATCLGALGDSYTLRFSVPTAAASIFGEVALQLAANVKRRTNGRLNVEVYPNGQLARERESIDGLISGVIDLTLQGTTFLTPLFPNYAIFDVPFLFKDVDAAFRVLDGSIGADFFSELDARGIVGLCWGGGGFKELETTSKAITTPEDMKGVRMRTQQGALYVAMYEALGAIPVTIDISETFTALQQRTVDGMDGSLDSFTQGKYYSLCRHVALSNHVFSGTPIVGSKRKLEALPADLQKALKDEAKAIGHFWRLRNAQKINEDIEILKKDGVAITSIQYPTFRRAMDPLYATYQAKLGNDIFERIACVAGT